MVELSPKILASKDKATKATTIFYVIEVAAPTGSLHNTD